MLRSSRRSSLVGSQHSIPSRRSSGSLKDVERIQIAEAQVEFYLNFFFYGQVGKVRKELKL